MCSEGCCSADVKGALDVRGVGVGIIGYEFLHRKTTIASGLEVQLYSTLLLQIHTVDKLPSCEFSEVQHLELDLTSWWHVYIYIANAQRTCFLQSVSGMSA